MEFRDLKKQYQVLKEPMDQAIAQVLRDANYISGKQVTQLEQSLCEYTGVRHCVTCGNGTDALSMALMAWGIGEGDAVFVPDFTFFASGETVSFEGATPVFVDVDADTFNLDPDCLEEAIRRVEQEGKLRPRAVVAVDLFGLPADYTRIRPIADAHGLLILEDGAQGFGGAIGDKRVGSFGDISTTSFFPAKPLGCYGDGGAIFLDRDDWNDYLCSIRVHGKGSFKYDNVRIGWNSRLDTIQAAVLQVKLDAFKKYELADVNRAAGWYTQRLQGLVKTPVIPEGFSSSWAQYTITLQSEEQRQRIQEALKAQGIPTMVYYPKPMHLQGAFADLGGKEGDFPVTERLCRTVLSLPIHPYITEEEVEQVCNALRPLL